MSFCKVEIAKLRLKIIFSKKMRKNVLFRLNFRVIYL